MHSHTRRNRALTFAVPVIALFFAGCGEAPVTTEVDPTDSTGGVVRTPAADAQPVVWQHGFTIHESTCGIGTLGRLECLGPTNTSPLPLTSDEAAEPSLASAAAFFGGDPCGLTTESELRCVAGGKWQQLGAASGRFVAVDGGAEYGCALADGGIPWCWWTEVISRSSSRPLHIGPVPGAIPLARLQTGSMFACGLTPPGEAFCWNFGPVSDTRRTTGQLGDGTVDASASPVRVMTDVRFASLSVGAAHACGLSTAGEAWCWGSNMGNALGVSRDASREGCSSGSVPYAGWQTHWCTIPQRVETDLRFSAIAAGNERTCAVATDGRAYCWGANEGWTLGIMTVGDSRCQLLGPMSNAIECTARPVAVAGNVRFAGLWKATSGYHQCGIGVDGRTYCWGTVQSDGRPGRVVFSEPGVPAVGSAEPMMLMATAR